MEHIRQFDWCASQPDIYFLNEKELDNCVTERILSNKFFDPLISSDSENESKESIDWSTVFRNKENEEKDHRIYVAGCRTVPPYPKLSTLSAAQHYQCLKVLCADNPAVLEAEFLPRPTKQDRKVFADVQSTYIQEQQEYIEWAKTLWTNGQCVRALRPKPTIEMVYEAEVKMRTSQMESFPKNYEMAAQIPLEMTNNEFVMVLQKDLISVNIKELPEIDSSNLKLRKKLNILRPCAVPEPCNKHPCKFVLPTEKSMSILPLTEIHKELAQYALDNGCRFLASENALKCLVEQDRHWTVPLSVSQVIGPDGNIGRVLVLGSEFPSNAGRESAPARTYRAYRHMLECALVPTEEKVKSFKKTLQSSHKESETRPSASTESLNFRIDNMDVSSDEDEDHLTIDFGDTEDTPELDAEESRNDLTLDEDSQNRESGTEEQDMEIDKQALSDKETDNSDNQKKEEFYNCSCKDTQFESVPPRSYRIWQLRNNTTRETYNMIVHCSHKVRRNSEEVILEPIPEYQIELGGSSQSEAKMKSLALSLCLRKNASLFNVRVDGSTGDVVTVESVPAERPPPVGVLHTALGQLEGLLPGHYVLQHEPSHGTNALLLRASSSAGAILLTAARATDEAKEVRACPVLAPVLLPVHKLRKILPCAFTPDPKAVVKETKKPAARQRTPPQAIKWPGRKRPSKKRRT